ncbi:MAG: hypothetical protein ACOCWR_02300 [Oceanidesulfovibrio sp.]
MVDTTNETEKRGAGPTPGEREPLDQECARQTARARLGLILATLGAVLLGGGLVEVTVLRCSTLNISIVLGMLAVGMVLLLGGGLLTGLALFASRRLGNSQAAQRARRTVTRFYVVIILLVAGVLAMAYAITMRPATAPPMEGTPSGAAHSGAETGS